MQNIGFGSFKPCMKRKIEQMFNNSICPVKPLFRAVIQGDVALVKELIEMRVDMHSARNGANE